MFMRKKIGEKHIQSKEGLTKCIEFKDSALVIVILRVKSLPLSESLWDLTQSISEASEQKKKETSKWYKIQDMLGTRKNIKNSTVIEFIILNIRHNNE